MTSLLSSHLNQISLCANSIADLPFPGPKPFTTALLSNTHDITALIRDTEQHERALFHLAPPPLPSKSSATDFGASLQSGTAPSQTRKTTSYAGRQPRNKAVAAVLGGHLYSKTRRPDNNRQRGELDVGLLLEGAEKLASVYPITGANDRIATLRRRHQQLQANIQHYEARVASQQRELERMNRPAGFELDEEQEVGGDGEVEEGVSAVPMSREDFEKEEEEIRGLERKKRSLEDRVTGMERDLGGLMR